MSCYPECPLRQLFEERLDTAAQAEIADAQALIDASDAIHQDRAEALMSEQTDAYFDDSDAHLLKRQAGVLQLESFVREAPQVLAANAARLERITKRQELETEERDCPRHYNTVPIRAFRKKPKAEPCAHLGRIARAAEIGLLDK